MRLIVKLLSEADIGLESNSVSQLQLVTIFLPWLYNPFDILGLHRFGRKLATTFVSQLLNVSTCYCKAILRRNLYWLLHTVPKWTFKEFIAFPHEFLTLPDVSRYFQCT